MKFWEALALEFVNNRLGLHVRHIEDILELDEDILESRIFYSKDVYRQAKYNTLTLAEVVYLATEMTTSSMVPFFKSIQTCIDCNTSDDYVLSVVYYEKYMYTLKLGEIKSLLEVIIGEKDFVPTETSFISTLRQLAANAEKQIAKLLNPKGSKKP